MGGVFTVDDQTGTAGLNPRSLMANTAGGNLCFGVPVGGVRFLSFCRGHRITIVVPPGYRANDQRIEMVDERWESAELQLLIQSRHSDARSTIEYRVSNIRRTEPPAHLFELPAHYTQSPIQSTVNEPAMSFIPAESPRAGAFVAGKMR